MLRLGLSLLLDSFMTVSWSVFAAASLPPLDLTVSRFLGTSRPEEIMLNRIVPRAGSHLGGVHIETVRVPNRFYLFDSANNRILGFYGWKKSGTP